MTILLALLLVAVLPGIAGGVLLTSFSPDPSRPGALLARVLSCGVASWLLTSGLLARTIGLTETSSWATSGLLALGSLVLLSLSRSRAVLRLALPELGYLAALLLVTAVSWLPVGALVVQTTWGPLGSTPWYYWSLADKIAQAGHVPETATEWGTTLPFLDDYHLFSTGTAMLFTQDAAASARALQVVTVLSVVLLACGAALLANAFGAGRLPSLAAVPFVVATGIGAVRITSYRPEAFAFGMVFLLGALFVDWLRHGERGSLAVGCLLTAVLSRVHGIALLTAGVFLIGTMLALCPRHGAMSFVRRCVLSGLALGASGLISAVILGGASGTAHTGNLSDRTGLADPTWQFIRAIRALPPSLPPSNQELVSGAVKTVYEGTGWWVGLTILAATVVLAIAAIKRWKDARQILTFALATLVGLMLSAAVFAFGWSSYVPRRTGASRLVQEATLLVGPFIACALAGVQVLARRDVWQKVISSLAVAVLCSAGLVSSSRLGAVVAHQRPAPSAREALASLMLPPDAVVLANGYTEGYIEQVMKAEGLLEGRAPYTFPGVLKRANSLLRGAAAFYESPARNVGFLDKNNVTHVVAARRHAYSVGTGNIFEVPVRRSRLDACPGLVRVLSQPGLTVYRVIRDRLSS